MLGWASDPGDTALALEKSQCVCQEAEPVKGSSCVRGSVIRCGGPWLMPRMCQDACVMGLCFVE